MAHLFHSFIGLEEIKDSHMTHIIMILLTALQIVSVHNFMSPHDRGIHPSLSKYKSLNKKWNDKIIEEEPLAITSCGIQLARNKYYATLLLG